MSYHLGDTTKIQQEPEFSRRRLLRFALFASLVALGGQFGTALFGFLKPRIEQGGFGGKVVAGQVDEFEPGTVSYVQKGRFFISRLEDGGTLALWHRCTHLGCVAPWREEEGVFHCPCHSSIFTTTGEVVSGPAPRPLDLFPVEIVAGLLVVDTGNPIQRDRFEPSQLTYA